MAGEDTKQKILEVSLTLFSQRGFAAVSIRDICKIIQIKESSIYYHFTNKQAILDELQYQFEATAAGLMQQLDDAIANSGSAEGNWGECISKPFFEGYLLDEFCNKFMRLLYMEQNNDEKMRQAYDKWIFQEPLKFQRKVFSILYAQKIVKSEDSDYLAVKFYSPIFLFSSAIF